MPTSTAPALRRSRQRPERPEPISARTWLRQVEEALTDNGPVQIAADTLTAKLTVSSTPARTFGRFSVSFYRGQVVGTIDAIIQLVSTLSEDLSGDTVPDSPNIAPKRALVFKLMTIFVELRGGDVASIAYATLSSMACSADARFVRGREVALLDPTALTHRGESPVAAGKSPERQVVAVMATPTSRKRLALSSLRQQIAAQISADPTRIAAE